MNGTRSDGDATLASEGMSSASNDSGSTTLSPHQSQHHHHQPNIAAPGQSSSSYKFLTPSQVSGIVGRWLSVPCTVNRCHVSLPCMHLSSSSPVRVWRGRHSRLLGHCCGRRQRDVHCKLSSVARVPGANGRFKGDNS